jgi:hypothetical protein
LDPANLLFLLDSGEIAHEPGNHLGDRLIDHAVVDVKLKADLEVPDARLVFEGVL